MATAVVVTGASRSFGRCLALSFARLTRCSSLSLFLLARDAEGLAETARLATAAWAAQTGNAPDKLRTVVERVDLGDQSDYVPKVEALITQLKEGGFERVLLVHNAGSLGDLGFVQELSTPAALAQYWEMNLTSVCWLNARFLEAFGASREELLAADVKQQSEPSAVIVNVTSLCGIKAFATYGVYCTGKAAREMHHGVIAAEQAPVGRVRVLSYSPGPMDTGMQEAFRESPKVHPALASNYIKMKAEGTLVDPQESADRGVRLALSGDFETGAHVDYYDLDNK